MVYSQTSACSSRQGGHLSRDVRDLSVDVDLRVARRHATCRVRPFCVSRDVRSVCADVESIIRQVTRTLAIPRRRVISVAGVITNRAHHQKRSRRTRRIRSILFRTLYEVTPWIWRRLWRRQRGISVQAAPTIEPSYRRSGRARRISVDAFDCGFTPFQGLRFQCAPHPGCCPGSLVPNSSSALVGRKQMPESLDLILVQLVCLIEAAAQPAKSAHPSTSPPLES